MTTETLIEALVSRGFEICTTPGTKAVGQELLFRVSTVITGRALVSLKLDAPPEMTARAYVSVVTNDGNFISRWIDLDVAAVEAFIHRAERIVRDWDSMTITFTEPA